MEGGQLSLKKSGDGAKLFFQIVRNKAMGDQPSYGLSQNTDMGSFCIVFYGKQEAENTIFAVRDSVMKLSLPFILFIKL